jgi:hypothetical protein
MGLVDFPDPIAMFEGAQNAGLEREIVNALVSSAYSAWISAMWRSGSAKWVLITGEGQALKDAATAVYLSLRDLERKGFLTLTVPTDLIDADNLARFQTSSQEKKT